MCSITINNYTRDMRFHIKSVPRGSKETQFFDIFPKKIEKSIKLVSNSCSNYFSLANVQFFNN